MALIEFYGEDCPHCRTLEPIVKRLEDEGIKVLQLEVWQNEENARQMAECDKGLCGGVPFFYNTETRSFLCGESTYDDLKSWATSK